MKKNRLLCTLFALALMISLAGIDPALAQDKSAPIKLRVASTFPPPAVSMQSAVAEMWMNEVTRKTNGRVTFQVFWGGALGKPQEHITLVEKGMADLVLTNLQFTPGKFPLAQFEYVFPFGPTDPVIVTKAKSQVHKEFPEFAQDLAKSNAIQLMNTSACVYQIMSKDPVTKLDEFKGRKISLIGRYFGRWVQAAGAVPVVAPAAERYTMLQTNVVDMDMLPLDMFSAFKIQEQAPNLIIVNALMGNFVDFLVNKNVFQKLPKDIQTIFVETGKEVEMKTAEVEVKKWTQKIMKQFESTKCKSLPDFGFRSGEMG